jgi:hypothetical protein
MPSCRVNRLVLAYPDPTNFPFEPILIKGGWVVSKKIFSNRKATNTAGVASRLILA